MSIKEGKVAQICWDFLGFGTQQIPMDIIQSKGTVFFLPFINEQLKFFKVMLC